MATKSRKKTTQPADDNALAARARTTLRPNTSAAAVIAEFGKPFGNQDVTALSVQLKENMAALKDDDLQSCEAMLFGQAHALQSIFVNLSLCAARNLGEYMDATERYLRLALKAQSQCVRTLEVLGALKNPQPLAFVNQANIAHNQQVNNGAAAETVPSPSPSQPVDNAADQNAETLYFKPSRARGKRNRAKRTLSQAVEPSRQS